jgi:hypothetical protein
VTDQAAAGTTQGAKRIYFHIGAPKTGTTYLQHVLLQNKQKLAEAGVLYPYDDHGQSFRSMQDFRKVGWGTQRASAFKGEWRTVADRARDWTGSTVVISNELLGGATPERIASGLADVGPADIHVIFSARDFARQLVSDWQEHIKHKHQVTLETFVDDLIELGLDAPKPFGELFWGMHDAAYVLRRWSVSVPTENIHVVTLPPPGAPRDTLWRRFCQTTGIDPDPYDAVTESSNPSMGVAETELVRRMNADVQGMPPENYDPLVRIQLAEHILGGQPPKLVLPTGRMDWVTERSRRLIDELRVAGYDVVGDLEDLIPRPEDHEGYVSPTELTDADLGPAAVRAASGLLQLAGRQRRQLVDWQNRADGIPPPKRSAREASVDAYWSVRGRVGTVLRKLGLLKRP